MHFATPRQLIAIVLAWAALLVAYDQHMNPKPPSAYWAEFRGRSTRPTVVSEGDTPRMRLSMPHLCCTGCLNDLRAALKPFTWLGPARLAADLPDKSSAPSAETPEARQVDVEILDLTRADFVALQRALEETGLVPDRIEVSGMGHFRVEVELPHLCCSTCSKVAAEPLERLLRKETQGRWLDSMTLDPQRKTVVIYARFNAVVDLAELETAIAHAGFYAHAIRVATGPES